MFSKVQPLYQKYYTARSIKKQIRNKTIYANRYNFNDENSKQLSEVHTSKLLHILTFPGDGDEGVYTIKETIDHIPIDHILAFRTFDDAFRYKILLEAETEFKPYIQFTTKYELTHVCAVGNYSCRVINLNALIIPPTKVIDITDWERRNALIRGKWSVLKEEIEDC